MGAVATKVRASQMTAMAGASAKPGASSTVAAIRAPASRRSTRGRAEGDPSPGDRPRRENYYYSYLLRPAPCRRGALLTPPLPPSRLFVARDCALGRGFRKSLQDALPHPPSFPARSRAGPQAGHGPGCAARHDHIECIDVGAVLCCKSPGSLVGIATLLSSSLVACFPPGAQSGC